jgi:hypothetical protein
MEVEGSIGVESGCEIPGVDDEGAEGGVFGLVVEGGGCKGGAPFVAGRVATERESEDGDGRSMNGKRKRRLRLQEVQSIAETLEERWWGMIGQWLFSGGNNGPILIYTPDFYLQCNEPPNGNKSV